MVLVDYSDSDHDSSIGDATPPTKKRRVSGNDKQTANALPPLPTAFRDLYSSAVRTSTQDDPSLHGGRKRVTPHVAGSWPTHVYLEWNPDPEEHHLLAQVVRDVQKSSANQDGHNVETAVHSLLENDLGVHLPLHVSLTRPLALKTEHKDVFKSRLRENISASAVKAFRVEPLNLIWHANEDSSRWFLVLRLRRPAGDELGKLLKNCNELASDFKQPLLYKDGQDVVQEGEGVESDPDPHDNFHISIAWSLCPYGAKENREAVTLQQAVPLALLEEMDQLYMQFDSVKIRIGQDITSVTLPTQRAKRSAYSN